ncbi:MAG: 4Fe-4S binding protein [Actinobacteria bacterium]|nr:4Fe-4S binding protein [Actinomycetota bacterium]
MAKKKIVLHFPEESIEKPVTYHLVKDFDLMPNILRARIDENEGTLVMDLEGPAEQIKKGIAFLQDQNIGVQEAIKDIIVDQDQCVDCGSCIGVCRPGALTIGPADWRLGFDHEKCVFCELCINTCPVKAIKVQF